MSGKNLLVKLIKNAFLFDRENDYRFADDLDKILIKIAQVVQEGEDEFRQIYEIPEFKLYKLDDYVNKIEPNTYAMVRGENLYNLLIAIKNLLDSHVHNINEPLVKTDDNWVKLNALIETLRNDLLNDSIRIN